MEIFFELHDEKGEYKRTVNARHLSISHITRMFYKKWGLFRQSVETIERREGLIGPNPVTKD